MPETPAVIAWIMLLAGVLTAIRYIWTKWVKPGSEWMIDAYNTLKHFGDNMHLLERLSTEFRPNGGSTMRDAIDELRSMMRKFEQTLSIHAQRQQAIWNAQAVAVFEADALGKVTRVSRQWCDLTGTQADDARGFGWLGSVAQAHRENVRQEWLRCIEQTRLFEMEFELRRQNGNGGDILKVLATATPLWDGSTFLGMVGFVRLRDDWQQALADRVDELEYLVGKRHDLNLPERKQIS